VDKAKSGITAYEAFAMVDAVVLAGTGGVSLERFNVVAAASIHF
jgi:hypothetical protein